LLVAHLGGSPRGSRPGRSAHRYQGQCHRSPSLEALAR